MMKRGSRRLLWALVCAGLLAGCGGPGAQPATPADGPGDEPAATPDDSDAIAEGEAAIKNEDFAKAKEIFSEIVSRRPDHPKANHYLAVALEHLGDTAGAEKHYRAALEAAPSLADAALNLSVLLMEAKKFEDAVDVLDTAGKASPKDPAIRINLAYAKMGMNDAAGAEAAFAAALAIADTPEARLGLAELQIDTNKSEEALANIDKAVALGPDNLDVLAMSAETYRKARAPGKCISTYDRALAIKPVGQLYASRGVCKQMNKDNAGAKADYRKAVEVDPSYAPAFFNLGRLLLSEKDKKGAIEAFEACAKLAPESKCAAAAEQAKK